MIFRLLRSIICAELCSRPVRRSLGEGGSTFALVGVVAGVGPIQTRRRSATEVVCSRPVRRSLGEGGSAFALVEVVAGCRAYPNAKAFGYEVVCSRPVRRSLGVGGSASALVEVFAGVGPIQTRRRGPVLTKPARSCRFARNGYKFRKF